MAHGK